MYPGQIFTLDVFVNVARYLFTHSIPNPTPLMTAFHDVRRKWYLWDHEKNLYQLDRSGKVEVLRGMWSSCDPAVSIWTFAFESTDFYLACPGSLRRYYIPEDFTITRFEEIRGRFQYEEGYLHVMEEGKSIYFTHRSGIAISGFDIATGRKVFESSAPFNLIGPPLMHRLPTRSKRAYSNVHIK